MHKKNPKICTGCRVSTAKMYLYHSTKIAKARPHSEDCQTDTSVQKQWSMTQLMFSFDWDFSKLDTVHHWKFSVSINSVVVINFQLCHQRECNNT